ncbi:MAG: FAD-binding oxidoreductase [Actinomycetia bacterium]|nr:FAD-binding oxidoreductase [Actinomycetes bacterium]
MAERLSPLRGAHVRPLLERYRPRLDDEAVTRLRAALRGRFGRRAVINDHALLAYAYDATTERHRPHAAVLAASTADVVDVLRIAGRFGVPVIPRGSGSNISGGTVPVVGGVVLSLAGMKAVREIDLANRRVVVEPGLTNAELQAILAPHGFFFPPDPASHRISSLGGNVGEGSGGPHCVKYGVTSHYVRAVEAVLADGTVVTCPGSLDGERSLDWGGLLVGSEGVLAVATLLELTVVPRPEATATLLAAFADLTTAVRAVSAVVAARIVPSTLELLDRASLDAVRPFIDAGYPEAAAAVLLVEVDGPRGSVGAQAERAAGVLARAGAVFVEQARDAAHADRLMAARRAAYAAVARLGAHIWVQDVTVPRPLLAEMMEFVLAVRERYRLPLATLAHAGDGNLHPLIPYDPEDPEQWERMRAADREILERAAALDGSITGEHGIGVDKLETLPLMYGPTELAGMWAVKGAFDPAGRLNPGKAVYPLDADATGADAGHDIPSGGCATVEPTTGDELAVAVREAAAGGRTLAVRGAGRHSAEARGVDAVCRLTALDRVVDWDPDNLTVEVEAGMTLDRLDHMLAEGGLMFPAQPWTGDGTVGGLVAGVFDGPRRFGFGPLKNWVLGVTVVDGLGRRHRYGRKVVKNVAGLDMPKLFVGSHGRFGVLERVVLRLWPRAETVRVGRLPLAGLPPGSWAQWLEEVVRAPVRPQGLWLKAGLGDDGPSVDVLAEGWEGAAVREVVDGLAAACGLPALEWLEPDAAAAYLGTLARAAARGWDAARSGTGVVEQFAVRPRDLWAAAAWLAAPTGRLVVQVGDGWITRFASGAGDGPPPFAPTAWRRLDGHGWTFGPEDPPALAAIRERLAAAFDPRGVWRGSSAARGPEAGRPWAAGGEAP